MTRYYLHLQEGGTLLEDLEGRDCASLAEAMRRAVESARDVMAGEIREGRLCLSSYIVVADEHGRELGRVGFGDAVAVTGL